MDSCQFIGKSWLRNENDRCQVRFEFFTQRVSRTVMTGSSAAAEMQAKVDAAWLVAEAGQEAGA